MPRRVLQVVAVPDGAPLAAAGELHRFLDTAGVEVRTLAAGPAPSTARPPSVVLPPMAPSARSLAALTQLRREARWADVVVLRGRAGAFLARGAGLRAVWCVDDPARGRAVPRRRVGATVVPVAVEGGTPDHVDVLPPVVVPPVRLPVAARSAARTALGAPDGAPVVLLGAGVGPAAARSLAADAAGAGWWVVPAGADAELVLAATDVVVHAPVAGSGVAVDTLLRVLAGAAPLTPAGGDWAGRSHDSAAFAAGLGRLADGAARSPAASAAATEVLERYGPDTAGAQWLALLGRVGR